jgi:hypothetical protein
MTNTFEEELRELLDLQRSEDLWVVGFVERKINFIEKYGPQPLVNVPKCVDFEIKYRRNNSYSGIKPSDGLLLMQVFQDLNSNGKMDRTGEEGYWQDGEFYKWMQSSQNFPTFFKAVTEGYIVESSEPFQPFRVKLGELYFKHWDDVDAVFAIDDQPGAIESAYVFNTRKEAENVAKLVGGSVEPVNHEELEEEE